MDDKGDIIERKNSNISEGPASDSGTTGDVENDVFRYHKINETTTSSYQEPSFIWPVEPSWVNRSNGPIQPVCATSAINERPRQLTAELFAKGVRQRKATANGTSFQNRNENNQRAMANYQISFNGHYRSALNICYITCYRLMNKVYKFIRRF